MLLMVAPLVSMVVAPISGWLSDRIGPRFLTTAGLAVVAGALLQASRFTDVTRIPEIALCMGTMGLGAALFQPPNTSSVMRAVPLTRLGVASGLVAMSRSLGMVTGVSLAGALFSLGFGPRMSAENWLTLSRRCCLYSYPGGKRHYSVRGWWRPWEQS
jgi:MFS family permease